jgi:putative ABC transport system substrate-binding protein
LRGCLLRGECEIGADRHEDIYVGDPVASGLVSSLARPGANVTGLSMLASEMSQKSLELLKEIVPSLSRLTVLLDSRNPGMALPYQRLAAAAKGLGVNTQHVDIQTSANLEAAFAAVASQRAQALYIYPLPISPRDFQRVAGFAINSRLPAVSHHQPYLRTGLLLSYGTDLMKQFYRVGTFVDRILKGVKPGDLPVEQPEEFKLTINLKTAKALGLQIPQSVLVRADEIIK